MLWRHQAAYVPLCNASCGRVMGRGLRRQGNVCEFILRQVIYLFRRVAAIIWPLNRCITLSGTGIGSRQLRRKGSGRSLCPPPCNLSEPTHGYDVCAFATAGIDVYSPLCELGLRARRLAFGRRSAAIIRHCAAIVPRRAMVIVAAASAKGCAEVQGRCAL